MTGINLRGNGGELFFKKNSLIFCGLFALGIFLMRKIYEIEHIKYFVYRQVMRIPLQGLYIRTHYLLSLNCIFHPCTPSEKTVEKRKTLIFLNFIYQIKIRRINQALQCSVCAELINKKIIYLIRSKNSLKFVQSG